MVLGYGQDDVCQVQQHVVVLKDRSLDGFLHVALIHLQVCRFLVCGRALELQVRGVCRALRAMRGGLVIGAGIVCDAMCCAGCDAIRCARAAMHGMRCNAMRAGWLHSRGAGVAMLLTEGFLGWLSRFKGMGGLVGGGMGGRRDGMAGV